MIKQVLFLATVLFVTSCSFVRVVNINDAQKHYENAIIYNLPETVLKIDIEVTKTSFTKGPYCEFAEKYLSIANVKKADETKFEISKVDINSFSEPDYNNYYVIESNVKSLFNNLSFDENGTLLSINGNVKKENKTQNYETIQKQKSTSNNVLFTDMSVKKNFNEVKIKTPRDTSSNKPRIPQTKLEEKDFETKAEEAANFIIKLRKRKFSLMVGTSEKVPADGKAVEAMLNELNKLEQSYVELFIGKESQETLNYSYTYTPSKDKENNTGILTYFSNKYGIFDKEFNASEQITLKIIADGKTNVIDSYLAKKELSETKEIEGIVYRIPDLATIQILKGESIVAQKKLQIAQTGTLNVISKELLKKKGFAVEFNPEFGSLKSIGN